MISKVFIILITFSLFLIFFTDNSYAMRIKPLSDKLIIAHLNKAGILEEHPQSERVKVKFPWLRISRDGSLEVRAVCGTAFASDNENSSCWIRVPQI